MGCGLISPGGSRARVIKWTPSGWKFQFWRFWEYALRWPASGAAVSAQPRCHQALVVGVAMKRKRTYLCVNRSFLLTLHRINTHFVSRNILREMYLGAALKIDVASFPFLMKIIDVVCWPQPFHFAVEVYTILFHKLSSLSTEAPTGKKYVFRLCLSTLYPNPHVCPQPLFHIANNLTNTLLYLIYLFGILCTTRDDHLWFETTWW